MGGFVGRMVAGEQVPLMVSEGQGTVLYGHGGMQTKIVQIAGDQLTSRPTSCSATTAACRRARCSWARTAACASSCRARSPAKGLFTTQLTGHGTAVMLSHGPVFELQVGGNVVPVDPQAYVGHKGMIDTKLDAQWAGATRSAAAPARPSRSSARDRERCMCRRRR